MTSSPFLRRLKIFNKINPITAPTVFSIISSTSKLPSLLKSWRTSREKIPMTNAKKNKKKFDNFGKRMGSTTPNGIKTPILPAILMIQMCKGKMIVIRKIIFNR